MMDAFEDQLTAVVKQAVSATAINAVVIVRSRIEQGMGLDDKPMPGYSAGYKASKARKGRQTERRDMTFSGQMLGGIHATETTVQDGKVSSGLAITGARNREIATYQQRRTPFFGFSPSDEREIQVLFERELQRLLQEAL